MNKKVLFTVLFLSIAAFSLNAQNNEELIGKWIFKKALNEGIDDAGMAYLKAEVIDKWKFEFNKNGAFETSMSGEKETGLWKINPDSKTLILSGIEGSPYKFDILKLTQEELILKLSLGEFLLRRI